MALLCGGLLLAGCGSSRFGGPGPDVRARRPAAPYNAAPDAVVQAAPSGAVTSEPLPPPPGASAGPASGTNPGGFGSGPVVADVPTMPGSPGPVETMTPSAAPPVAEVSRGPTRSTTIGNYTAHEAAGASCRVQLSSSPALDLYKASASGCASKDLSRVTAWDLRDGEVYLYQPGGAVAARLRSSGRDLSGVLAKSGAPLSLSR